MSKNKVLFLLISSSVAGFFGRFLGSEASNRISSPALLLVLLFSKFYFYLQLSKRKKSAMILFFFLYFLGISISYLVRFKIFSLLGTKEVTP